MNPIIQVENLKKSYHGQEAVRGISFSAEKGTLTALLGPNGAGKSTTVNILCTSILPDSGLVCIDGLTAGRQNHRIRQSIGIVFQNGVLDEPLTVAENLHTRGRLYGLHGKALPQRIMQAARITGTDELLDRPYGQLSGGQRRRCDIARALLHSPKILFLDEPTTGLDPKMRRAIWNTIDEIRRQTRMTIFLTTHYMEEAAQADQIILMAEGKIAASGTPAALKERFCQNDLLLRSCCPEALKKQLALRSIGYRQKDCLLQIPLASSLEALPVLTLCTGLYTGFEVRQGTLEDVYLSVMERKWKHD